MPEQGESTTAPSARPHGAWLAWLAPLAVGVTLRVVMLPAQVMGGDELHAVRAMLRRPAGELLLEYSANNLCRPLLALQLAWFRATGSLSELGLRLPVVLAGLAALVVLPLLARAAAGRRAGWVVAWLVALSPQLVIYSHIARSYVPITLIAALAAASFHAWWTSGAARLDRRAWAYALLATLGVFTHLLSAPFLLAPFVFAALDVALRRGDERRVRATRLAALGGVTALLLAAVLLPGLESLRELAEGKSGVSEPGAVAVLGTLVMHAGSASLPVAGWFWALAAFGALRLLRRDRPLALFLATLCAAQVVSVLVLSPQAVDRALVLSRYLIVTLPVSLLLVGVALDGRSRVARVVAAGSIALFALAGPFAESAVRRTSFLAHNDQLELHLSRLRPGPVGMPDFYAEVSPDDTLLEAPWPWGWMHNGAFYAYQELHGARVMVVPDEPLLSDPRLAFANMHAERPEALLASGARWLLVHLDLGRESNQLRGPGHSRQVGADERARLARHARGLVQRLRAAWGPPDRLDARLAVWDLARLRTESAR